MRKNILYLFYAATSVLILVTLNMDLRLVINTNGTHEPQYVFSQKNDDVKARKQKELEVLRKWAENFDPDDIKQ
ncbi:hypothetical protein [Vibrio sp. HN007]|uniref:hypothetical protein n=1 Tax=Vibrio iocasae TaxID=3098914 RepID=UPI0035D49E04